MNPGHGNGATRGSGGEPATCPGTTQAAHSRNLLSSPGISGEEIATLRPGENGTEAQIASTDQQIEALLESGNGAYDAVFICLALANDVRALEGVDSALALARNPLGLMPVTFLKSLEK